MAVPTLTANNPSAGFISWLAFTVQYNGNAYAVSASNTNQTYTAWLYNAGSPVVVTNNNAPTNDAVNDSTTTIWAGSSPTLGPDDLLLFINRSGVPINVQAASMLDGDLIVTGTVTASQIAANTIVAGNIAANTITAGQIAATTITAAQIATNTITTNQIAANTITATNIAAGAIGASSLTVGTLSNNRILNSMFEDVDGSGLVTPWTANWLSGSTATPVGSSTSTLIDGARSGLVTATASLTGDLTSNAFQVVPGQTMYVQAYLAKSVATMKFTMKMVFGATQTFTNSGFVSATPSAATNVTVTDLSSVSQAGVTSSTAAGVNNIVNAWTGGTANTIYSAQGQFVVPTGAQWARLALVAVSGTAGTLYVDDVETDAVTISAFIGNGQITANQIAANTITTSQLSATAINGMTITGATLRTAASGKRVEINVSRYDEIDFYSGDTHEIFPGKIQVSSFTSGPGPATFGEVILYSPDFGHGSVDITLTSATSDNLVPGSITIEADVPGHIYLVGDTELTGSFVAADAVFNNTVNMTEAQVGGVTLPRGTQLNWRAAGAPANTAVNGTEAVIYAGATVGSATIVSGRRYRLTVRGIVSMSALQTGSQGSIRVRQTNLTGAILLNIPIPIASTGLQSFEKSIELVGGTDITVGSQAFAITNLGTGSSNMTTSYTAGQIYTNVMLSLLDVGA